MVTHQLIGAILIVLRRLSALGLRLGSLLLGLGADLSGALGNTGGLLGRGLAGRLLGGGATTTTTTVVGAGVPAKLDADQAVALPGRLGRDVLLTGDGIPL